MATRNSTTRQAQVDGGANFNSRIDDKRVTNAKIQYAKCLITLLGTEVATDVYDLIELPANAIVYPEHSKFIAQDPGSALTVKVGDSVDDDRYHTGTALDAGGTVPFIAAAATSFPDGFVNPHKVTEATKLVKVTISTATTLTATNKVWVILGFACL